MVMRLIVRRSKSNGYEHPVVLLPLAVRPEPVLDEIGRVQRAALEEVAAFDARQPLPQRGSEAGNLATRQIAWTRERNSHMAGWLLSVPEWLRPHIRYHALMHPVSFVVYYVPEIEDAPAQPAAEED